MISAKDLEGKIIPPGLFIPVAESSGRINALGEIVFDRTCKFIAEKGLESMGIEWINVNLSPSQFLRTDLAERYSSIADKYGIDPGKVHLEITEGAMIDDNFLQRQITAMMEKGFKFVLDDYGTGINDMDKVDLMKPDIVKLDRSLISFVDTDPEKQENCKKCIEALHKKGVKVVAEGIEREEEFDLMVALGADLFQGYYLGRPA